MNTMLRKVMSFVLCFLLAASCLPVGTFAAEIGETVASEATEVTTEPTQAASEETEASSEPTEPSTEPEAVAVSGIALDVTNLEVGVGAEPVTLTATVAPENAADKTVTWTSSEPGVAAVVDGVVTFGYRGEAVITATAGAFSATCTVTVGEGDAAAYDGNTIYILAGSDFQPTDAKTSTGVNLLNQILDKVYEQYPTMDGFLFAGDYDYNYNASVAGKAALQSAVQTVYGTEMHEVYVQGNHDPDSMVGDTVSSSGANDAEDYGVFVINEKDYMWYNDDETTIKNTAAALDAYLDAKVEAKYDQPIFVVSHLPLHYCMRTQVGGGDGKHANYIFDVLNEAGANGLNIIFLFGHNHSHGWDDPYGGAAIFLTKGDSINIAQNSTTNYNVETLNFTYMNAGYISYYRHVNSGAETDLSMTVFAITGDKVTIERYTADGLHDLKSAGVANTHASAGTSVDGSCSTNHKGNETYAPDTSVVESSYTLTLNQFAPDETAELTGIVVTTSAEMFDFLVDGEMAVDGVSVHAVYSDTTTVPLTWDQTGENGYTLSGYDMSAVGEQTVTVTYGGFTDSFKIKVWNDTFTEDGVTVKVNNTGVSGITVGDVTDPATVEDALDGVLTNYVAYDIEVAGYVDGNYVTVTLPIPEGAANPAVYYVSDDGSVVTDMGAKDNGDGTMSFTTNHFSTYVTGDVMVAAEGTVDPDNWVEITAPVAASTRYVYELDTNGVDTGVEYLIVANSYPKAMSAAASSNNAVDIEISGNYAYANADTYGWTFTQYSNGVYYIHLNGSTYLALSNNAIGSSNSTGNSRRWTVTNNNDGSYDIVRNNYNLRWSNSNGVFQVSSSYEGPVRLYKYKEQQAVAAQPGLYGTIVGTTTYEVDMGTSWNDAKALVQEGIAVYYTTDNTATTGSPYADNGDGMTWTCENYDPAVPGDYTVTIAYNGVTLGTATVKVVEKTVTRIEVSPMNGKVQRGSSSGTETGSTMKVTYSDGTTAEIPVTLGMLEGDYDITKNGTYTGLTVNFGGQKVEGYTLEVVNVAGNDFLTYPNPGSVEVDKSAVGVDFQNTGLARVELSTSGLPAGQGVDIVIVIDTSSSMKDNYVGNTGKTRIQVLSESLADMLTQFQQPNATTGQIPDIDIAIIDFNGYYPNSVGSYDQISFTGSNRENVDYAKVFTGTNAGKFIKNVGLSAANFVDNTSLNPTTIAGYFTNDNCKSGTNYDGALENAYNLLAAKKAANTEERVQYVIFLSDGAPFRYNGYNNGSSKSTYNAWSNWLEGVWANEQAFKTAYPNTAYSYFYNGNGTTHPHRIAEAIKGDPNNTYDVVLRSAADNDPAYIDQYRGLGATIYSIGFGLADDGSDSEGGKVGVDTQKELIRVISSGQGYYYENVQSADALTTAFTQIVAEVSYAATNAVFEDQMGTAFDLQMNPTVKTNAMDEDGNPVGTTTVDTSITVSSLPIYTSAQVGTTVNDYTVTSEDVGKTYGTPTEVEKVTFAVDTSGNITATSTAKTEEDGNILNNGVIEASTFFYNTTTEVKTITLANGKTYSLPGETFYWNIGTINQKQFTLSYMVYLTGSMDGQAPASDSYDTNNYAKLSYTNYLGNEVSQTVPSPSMPWGGANVSYAFYLVDSNGKPLLQNGNQAENFLTAYKVTQPVLYKTINLNAGQTVLSAVGKEVLPEGYVLYDETAKYTVNVASGTGKSSWNIVYDSSKVQSTYVMGYKGQQDYSNASSADDTSYDYTHTTVYFAVQWVIGTVPDTVVIDYGLPVDISVMANDMFGDNGELLGVGAYTDTVSDTDQPSGFAASYDGDYGTATVNGDKVRYTPNTMAMNSYEKFSYVASYQASEKAVPQYYYGTVTVIPATTIYYEDDFVNLTVETKSDSGWAVDENKGWTAVGNADAGATQDEDRPGEYNLSAIDANNVYGYDSAYTEMSKYSLGSAAMVQVVSGQTRGKATFSFYGTGFDVISLTSNTTGTITVKVEGGPSNYSKTFIVDTYYGYTKNDDGEWVVSTVNTDNALYQIPVMKISGLDYGMYTVTITAAYAASFDHDQYSDAKYDFYLDAIRIYDPAGTAYGDDGDDGATGSEIDDVIEDAYKADSEGWPIYQELRNNVIAANSFDDLANDVLPSDEKMTGLVFIDGDAEVGNSQIEDYINYGPNNELYLAKGQGIAFMLDLSAYGNKVATVQLGIKLVSGDSGTYVIENVNSTGFLNAESKTVSTATDMYYDITNWRGGIIHIKNNSSSGAAIISLTNIKITFTEDPAANEPATVLYMTRRAAALTLSALNAASADETEPTEPETQPTEPETQPTEPETQPTEPETQPTEPETEPTEPETQPTEPETEPTEPETQPTEPETEPTEPETEPTEPTEPETEPTEPETEPTEPETQPTEPEVPETFEPEKLDVYLSSSSVKVGRTVVVTVTTSADVQSLTVNGTAVTRYVYSRWTGTKTWVVTVSAETVGEMDIEVVAYDAAGLASAPVANTVTVTENSGSFLDRLFGWIFG